MSCRVVFKPSLLCPAPGKQQKKTMETHSVQMCVLCVRVSRFTHLLPWGIERPMKLHSGHYNYTGLALTSKHRMSICLEEYNKTQLLFLSSAVKNIFFISLVSSFFVISQYISKYLIRTTDFLTCWCIAPKFKSHSSDVRLFVQDNTMDRQIWELSSDQTDLKKRNKNCFCLRLLTVLLHNKAWHKHCLTVCVL